MFQVGQVGQAGQDGQEARQRSNTPSFSGGANCWQEVDWASGKAAQIPEERSKEVRVGGVKISWEESSRKKEQRVQRP